MELILLLFVALQIYPVNLGPLPAGTYAVIQEQGAILRIDTRTGSMERCTVTGASVECVAVVQK